MWDELIGVSPFTRRVYWELLEKREKREAVAAKAQIDPELLTVQSMVGIMFGIDGERDRPDGEPGRKRDCDTLHSCDLWDRDR